MRRPYLRFSSEFRFHGTASASFRFSDDLPEVSLDSFSALGFKVLVFELFFSLILVAFAFGLNCVVTYNWIDSSFNWIEGGQK